MPDERVEQGANAMAEGAHKFGEVLAETIEKVDGLETMVGELASKVSGLDGKVGGLAAKVLTLDGKVGGLASKVSGLDGKVGGVETTVGDLDKKLVKYLGQWEVYGRVIWLTLAAVLTGVLSLFFS